MLYHLIRYVEEHVISWEPAACNNIAEEHEGSYVISVMRVKAAFREFCYSKKGFVCGATGRGHLIIILEYSAVLRYGGIDGS